jgi:hypothetical protein
VNVDIDSSGLFFAGCFLQVISCELFYELLLRFLLMAGLVDDLARSDINPSNATLFRFRNAAMKRPKTKRRRGTNRSALYGHTRAKDQVC